MAGLSVINLKWFMNLFKNYYIKIINIKTFLMIIQNYFTHKKLSLKPINFV